MEARAKSQIPKIVDRIGDVDAISHGGGVLYTTSHGTVLEYTEGAEFAEDDLLDVYRTTIESDIVKQLDLDEEEVDELCESLDEDEDRWRALCKSYNPTDRARCLVDAALYCGWDHIDSNPLRLSEVDLHFRWHSQFREEGPITTPGCFRPEVIVPEILRALHSAFPRKYWKIQGPPFPLVPFDPLQDPSSGWWDSHGAQALNKLVDIMKSLAPRGFEFSVKEETFGFWKK